MFQDGGWEPVNEEGSRLNTLTPERQRELGLKIEGTSHIEKVLVFSLNYGILLWSFHTAKLMYHAFISQKFSQVQLSGIIRSKGLDHLMKLCLHKSKESLNDGGGLGLMCHQVYPCEPGMVINQRQKKSLAVISGGVKGSPHITMYQVKNFRSHMIIRGKRQMFLFRKRTNITCMCSVRCWNSKRNFM